MRALIATMILLLVAALLALVAFILIRRAILGIWERRRQRWRDQTAQELTRSLSAHTFPLLSRRSWAVRTLRRKIVVQVILDAFRTANPAERHLLLGELEYLGQIDFWLRALR